MKYLIIGDADSMHIYNYIKTVLLPRKYEIHLLTLSTKPIRDEYLTFFKSNNVVVHSIAYKNYNNLNKKDFLHRGLQFLYKLILIHDVPMVDICHIHSVYKTSILIALLNKSRYKYLILSYWGSEILDKSKYTIYLREKCFKFANVITVIQEGMIDKFQLIHGHKFDKKLIVADLSTSVIDCIKEMSAEITRKDCRDTYNIPDDKICITCGYSAAPEQHQDTILEAIKQLEPDVQSRLCVVVPMQYGVTDTDYVNNVKDVAKTCNFQTAILEKFVPFEMSAKLAIATDIYIHIRDNDAYSNALKEHIYSNSYVIKGEWLKYAELEGINVPMKSIASLSLLKNTIREVIRDYKIQQDIVLFTPIYEMHSPESITNRWWRLIDSVLEN